MAFQITGALYRLPVTGHVVYGYAVKLCTLHSDVVMLGGGEEQVTQCEITYIIQIGNSRTK